MVTFVEENGQLRCVFDGPMNTTVCGAMAESLQARIDTAGLPVVFDLQGVDYVASAFFRICLVAVKKVGGDKLTIINLSPTCQRMFKIAGLDRIFKLAE